MKTIIVIIAMLFCGNAFATTDQQRHDIMSSCQVATGIKTRVSWVTDQAAANRCYYEVLDNLRQREYDQSVIDRNRAEAEWYRDDIEMRNRARKIIREGKVPKSSRHN